MVGYGHGEEVPRPEHTYFPVTVTQVGAMDGVEVGLWVAYSAIETLPLVHGGGVSAGIGFLRSGVSGLVEVNGGGAVDELRCSADTRVRGQESRVDLERHVRTVKQ